MTMLFADYGYAVHSQTYIVTEDSLATRRDHVMGLLKGEILGWQDYKSDTDAATQLTLDRFPDADLNPEAQRLQASEQLKLMFSEDTDSNGFLWFTDESVQANIATLGELGVEVTADLWDRSLWRRSSRTDPFLREAALPADDSAGGTTMGDGNLHGNVTQRGAPVDIVGGRAHFRSRLR